LSFPYSKQPLNWQYRQQENPRALQKSCIGFLLMADDIAINVLYPIKLTVLG